MVTGAKSKMWFTGFYSLFSIWYFNGKVSGLHFWSHLSDLHCSLSDSPVSFPSLPACRLSSWATAVCLSWEVCGQHRSPNFSGHLLWSLIYLLNINELKFLKGLCGYQGVWKITIASIGHKCVLSMKLCESCFNSGWKVFSAGNLILAANK